MSSLQFKDAQHRTLSRILSTREVIPQGLPHWADPETGEWTLTPDGDWTGGAYVGQLWLARTIDPTSCRVEEIHQAMARMAPRTEMKTAFKGFGFYYGAALGHVLLQDPTAREMALEAARSLAGMFDERLGLVPLGEEAEEASATGSAESSIDSLQASGLLFWAATELADPRIEDIAFRHTAQVLKNHVHADGSTIQSSTLDPETGEVIRTHTHKGYSDTSIWGRAQAWAMIYSSMAAIARPDEPLWLEYATRTADWWIANVPEDKVAYWDFSDPAIPDTSRDTAATAMATAALLKLSYALRDSEKAAAYETFARETASALIDGYLTPCRPGDDRPTGILTGGCFTRKSIVRSVDAATDVELIFGDYYLFEALAVLTGSLPAGRI